jgi:hypothetical protein
MTRITLPAPIVGPFAAPLDIRTSLHARPRKRKSSRTDGVSDLQLWLLRACYLLLVVGLAIKFWPSLLGEIATMSRMDGAVRALLSALGLLSIAGLFAPLRMLPLLVFEVAWKTIWVLTVALPNWHNGTLDGELADMLFNCAWATPILLIVPWRYAMRSLVSPTRHATGA